MRLCKDYATDCKSFSIRLVYCVCMAAAGAATTTTNNNANKSNWIFPLKTADCVYESCSFSFPAALIYDAMT